MDIAKLTQRPDLYLNAAFYGLEKRGKTTSAIACMIAAYRTLELQEHIAIVDTENMAGDWYDRIEAITGKPPAILPPNPDGDFRDPLWVMKFLRSCEEAKEICGVVIDSMTDLQRGPRDKFTAKEGRQPKLNEWSKIDAPYNDLCEYLKRSRLHRVYTFREADDKVEVDEQEKIIGKKAKGGQGGYIPRLMAHCTLRSSKGRKEHVIDITDTKSVGTHRVVTPEKTTLSDLVKVWEPYVERLK